MKKHSFEFLANWKEDSLYKKACIFALVLHGIGFFFLMGPVSSKPPKIPNKIVVHTIKTSPVSAHASSVSAGQHVQKTPVKKTTVPAKKVPTPPKKVEPSSVKKENKVTPKTPAKKEEPKTKAPAKPKPSAAPAPVPQRSKDDLQKSLEKIEETIAKIASKGDTMSSSSFANKASKFETLVESFSLTEEEEYLSSLVQHLQNQLELPDMGEVKVELALRRDGSVASVKVLYAESERNKKRLEQELPGLCFPPFAQQVLGVKTFILTFCNEV